MQATDPDVVAVACSGYLDAAVMSAPGQFAFAGVLAKPYRTVDLERVIEAFDGRGRHGTPGV
jgi:hypothetical protein